MSTFQITNALSGSIYSLDPAGGKALVEAVSKLEERVQALRDTGRLTEAILRRYYGQKRFEQVAESNAIEGSTLSVGETELAIVKGITITGHDPGYVRDAIALDKALQRLVELAKEQTPTDIGQVKELHELILEGRPSAGQFRTEPVRISGSQHRPPKTWAAVMDAMEVWERWSKDHAQLPAPFRAAILHAWLVWIHPFVDGNGRTARAVTTLELVRSGYPPAIVRRTQDRDRYIDALQVSDVAGDIGRFMDLLLERTGAGLTGLESAARETGGYNPAVALLRRAQARKLAVWNRSVELLYEMLADKLAEIMDEIGGEIRSEVFSNTVSIDDYAQLCLGHPIPQSWAFRVQLSAPGLKSTERLAWIGYRSRELRNQASDSAEFSPAIFWSRRNAASYPPWILAGAEAPRLAELSISPGQGDEWHCLGTDGSYRRLTTTQVATELAQGFAAVMAS